MDRLIRMTVRAPTLWPRIKLTTGVASGGGEEGLGTPASATHRGIANGILWSGVLSNFAVPPDKSPLIRNPLNGPH